MKRFEGIFVVMMSVFHDDGGIDRDAMEEVAGYLVDSGVHGLVVLGSNGECPYLSDGQRREAVEAVAGACGGRVPVIAGVNERGTDATIASAGAAEAAGADGLLVALHAFYPIDEDAVFAHYERVCGAVGVPVLYYNYPSATNLSLAPAAIARLAEIESLVGAKETIFDMGEVRALAEAAGDEFCVFSGMTLNLTAAMDAGACGAICPLPNVIPREAVELYEAIKAGDAERAGELQGRVLSFAPLLASSLTPHAMLKHALKLLGHPVSARVKGPLPPLTDAQAGMVEKNLRDGGLLE